MTILTEALRSITYQCPKCGSDEYMVTNLEHERLIPSGKCSKCKTEHTPKTLFKHYRKKYLNIPIPFTKLNPSGLIFICEVCASGNIIQPILVSEDRSVNYVADDYDDLPENRDRIFRDTIIFTFPDTVKCKECKSETLIEID